MDQESRFPGYEFAGWYVDEARTKRLNPGGILPRVMTIYDKWIPIWYPVIYNTHGGTNHPDNPRLVSVESEPVALQDPVHETKIFNGWYHNGRQIHSLPKGITGPFELHARFIDPYEIRFESNGGTALKPMHSGRDNRLPQLPIPRRHGFRFEGWYMDSRLKNKVPYPARVNQNVTLYASWAPEEFQITYDTAGGINSRQNPRTYSYYDGDIVLQPARKAGHTFKGWADERGNWMNRIPARSIGDKHLKAVFEPAAGSV